ATMSRITLLSSTIKSLNMEADTSHCILLPRRSTKILIAQGFADGRAPVIPKELAARKMAHLGNWYVGKWITRNRGEEDLSAHRCNRKDPSVTFGEQKRPRRTSSSSPTEIMTAGMILAL